MAEQISHGINKASYSLVIAKVPLCSLVAFSALFGNIYAHQLFSSQSIAVFVFVLILACGGASFNSYQERFSDKLMRRTLHRPMVQGKISEFHAIVQGGTLIFAGLGGLLYFTNFNAFLAGVLGIALYNLFYTRMKPWSTTAIIPGAICGAIPPYIGWLASADDVFSFRAMLPVLLLLFWQIPHFFLVLLNHREDYIDSIAPNMLKKLNEESLQRIFLPWITALVVTMLSFSVVPMSLGPYARAMIVANAAALMIFFYHQILIRPIPNYRLLFRVLNASLFFLMLIVSLDAL